MFDGQSGESLMLGLSTLGRGNEKALKDSMAVRLRYGSLEAGRMRPGVTDFQNRKEQGTVRKKNKDKRKERREGRNNFWISCTPKNFSTEQLETLLKKLTRERF